MIEGVKMMFFEREADLLSEIEELKLKGVGENEMYLVVAKKNQIPLVRERTNIQYSLVEERTVDRIREFFAGNPTASEVVKYLGESKEKSKRIYDRITNGEMMFCVEYERRIKVEEVEYSRVENDITFAQPDEMIGAGSGGVDGIVEGRFPGREKV